MDKSQLWRSEPKDLNHRWIFFFPQWLCKFAQDRKTPVDLSSSSGSQIRWYLAFCMWYWRCDAYPQIRREKALPRAIDHGVPPASASSAAPKFTHFWRKWDHLRWRIALSSGTNFYFSLNLTPSHCQWCIFMFTIDIFAKEWNLWAPAQKHEGGLQLST